MLITTVQVPSATTTIKKAYFTIVPDEEYTCRSSKGRVLLFVRIIFPVAGHFCHKHGSVGQLVRTLFSF